MEDVFVSLEQGRTGPIVRTSDTEFTVRFDPFSGAGTLVDSMVVMGANAVYLTAGEHNQQLLHKKLQEFIDKRIASENVVVDVASFTLWMESAFNCQDGLPRAWTHWPLSAAETKRLIEMYKEIQAQPEDIALEGEVARRGRVIYYALAWGCPSAGREKELVQHAWHTFQKIRDLSGPAVILWRRRPQYTEDAPQTQDLVPGFCSEVDRAHSGSSKLTMRVGSPDPRVSFMLQLMAGCEMSPYGPLIRPISARGY